MLIGELSRRTGVHPHQLRYYEDQKLLTPARGANGYRVYGADAVVTVVQIRRLLDAGLSTRDIAYLLPCATGTTPELEACPELLDALRERLRGLDEQIDTLSRTRRALRRYIAATEQQTGPGRAPAPSARDA
ncbi:MerR family transcriptional regulator [Streptomyces viridochromogenes]|uniref:Putative MerR-family transcriptional regulator n=1 Tax=Streptomyces viridochromogenes Tue57 TaxID=1160705 RepID=L8P1T4_STRVR|nr:MerR family transcriptional regulator [Streptomyces viridochromogenes]ELS51516.1 putative MerR-family transcriptional regulator [Streptomyces viridochromogenes Tue57]